MKEQKYVAYYRVSTARQGQSGLGLEAQRAAVFAFLGQTLPTHPDGPPGSNDAGPAPHLSHGSSDSPQCTRKSLAGSEKVWPGQLLAEFTEVETGKGANALTKRPQLQAAIQKAKKEKAKLLIAKLDRLARNVHFISTLMQSKIKFVCADMPDANELTIHLLAAVGEYERKLISERTKQALQAAKARGVKLGNPNLKPDNEKRKREAAARAHEVAPLIRPLRDKGYSHQAIADYLNVMEVKTARGGSWHASTVLRVLERLQA